MNQTPVPSLFAKLLAEENIHVRVNPSLTTAAFEPETRTLLLPNLSDFDSDAWLLFVAHEVGHAKYTPQDALNCAEVTALNAQYGTERVRVVLNVLEDIRIERAIRVRYQGLAGVFAKGYRSLVAQSFFGQTADALRAGWATAKPLDRLNLYGKVGALLHLSLHDADEIRWYNAAQAATAYADVLTIAREMLATSPMHTPPQQGTASSPVQGSATTAPSTPTTRTDAAPEGSEAPNGQDATPQDATGQDAAATAASSTPHASQTETSATTEQGAQGGDAAGTDPWTSDTMTAAQNFVQRQSKQWNSGGTIVLPRSFVHQHQHDYTVEEVLAGWAIPDTMRVALEDLTRRERKNASSVLAAMVNTFRMHQSAWQSRHEVAARTGVLDMTKLSQHRLVEDLFLRRTEVPTAKNHGLVLFIDWSSSMESVIATVLTQVLHLIWFAEQVQVPVEVYAFTDATERKTHDIDFAPDASCEAVFHRSSLYRSGSLVQYYRSDLPIATKLTAQAYLLTEAVLRGNIAYSRQHWMYANRQGEMSFLLAMPLQLRDVATTIAQTDLFWADPATPLKTNPRVHRMGGTPLHTCVLSGSDAVRAFRQRHRIEQCVSVWLTDGEDGHGIPTCFSPDQMIKDDHGRWRVEPVSTHDEVILADPTYGRTYRPRPGTTAFAQVLDAHRARTGATVLVVDITDTPVASYRRLIARPDLEPLADALQGSVDPSLRGRRMRRGSVLKPKRVKQTRRAVVLPSQVKPFPETGVFAINQQTVDTLACDAMLVSHPSWWIGEASFDRRAAQRVVNDETVLATGTDETMDASWSDKPTWSWSDQQARRVKVQSALTTNSRVLGMRKFADLIVPYIAIGRADAGVVE